MILRYLLPLLLILSGCTGPAQSQKQDFNGEYINRYEQLLRWKRYDYLKPYFKEIEQFLKAEARYKKIQIEATRIISIKPLNVEMNRFKVVVERREVQDASISLKTVHYLQYWDYDPLKKRWFLSDEQSMSLQ